MRAATTGAENGGSDAMLREKNAKLASLVAAQEAELGRLRLTATDSPPSELRDDAELVTLRVRVEVLEAELANVTKELNDARSSSSNDKEIMGTSVSGEDILPRDDRSDLYVLLAHMQLENQVLLKHLAQHGEEAVAAAREEAVALLEKAARGL